MISFGNDELNEAPELGITIDCPHCGKVHEIQYGQEILPDGTYQDSKALAFYTCGEKTYLAGIDGKNIMDNIKGSQDGKE